MPNTFTQLYIHLVFAVKYRETLISADWKERLHQYITGIIQNKGHKLIAINTRPDHAHILIGMRPDIALSDLVREAKRHSTSFVNKEISPRRKFAWQEGFGAFSCSKSQLNNIVQYIVNQDQHHRKKTFRDEYEAFLRAYAIEYDKRFLFEFIQDKEES